MSTFRWAAAALITVSVTSVARAQDPAVAPVYSADVARITTETVETPIVGTYELSGALKGELVVKRNGDRVTFAGDGGAEAVSLVTTPARVNAASQWTFDLGAVTPGIAMKVSHLTALGAVSTRHLVVRRAGSGLRGLVLVNGHPQGVVSLVRRKDALVVYGTYMGGMKVYAGQARDYLLQKGYKVQFMAGDWQAVIDALVAGETEGHPFSRVVMVSHGGWDGPMFEGDMCQMSAGENDVSFGDLIRAIRRGTTTDAKFIFSACHSGGSNRFEDFTDNGYRYTDDLARKTGRTFAGPMGETSTEYTLRLVKAVEGEGPTVQETRISTPSTVKTVPPSRLASSAKTVSNQPLGQP